MAAALEPAKASMAPRVFLERLVQLRLAEVRPERGRHDELGVGDLPEEEVAHAHLAAGPDEEVGVGVLVGVEMLRRPPAR